MTTATDNALLLFMLFMLFMQLARLTLVYPYDSDMDVGTPQPVAGSLSRPSRWSKRRKKRFAIDGGDKGQ